MKKGDRVICKVNLINSAIKRKCIPINKGYIDIIRDVVDPVDNSRTMLYLEEIKNPISEKYKQEFGYAIECFEKLVSDEELLEYRKNVSSKENLRPELIPIKHLIES